MFGDCFISWSFSMKLQILDIYLQFLIWKSYLYPKLNLMFWIFVEFRNSCWTFAILRNLKSSALNIFAALPGRSRSVPCDILPERLDSFCPYFCTTLWLLNLYYWASVKFKGIRFPTTRGILATIVPLVTFAPFSTDKWAPTGTFNSLSISPFFQTKCC